MITLREERIMLLTMDQLRALAGLARADKQIREAERERDAAERNCWELGISDRQVAAVGRDSYASVARRRQRWRAIRSEHQVIEQETVDVA